MESNSVRTLEAQTQEFFKLCSEINILLEKKNNSSELNQEKLNINAGAK